jgi:alpha-glucosidase
VTRLVAYYGEDGLGCHLPFKFHLVEAPWDARAIAAFIDTYEGCLPDGAWPNWVLGNHDKRRVASRVGTAQARVAAVLLLTLRGTPTMYYGDEIGMHDVPIPPERLQDTLARNVPGRSRDPQRTPMQWDAEPNAGFTTGTPWLPIPADAETTNVATEQDDPRSLLTLYRRLIALRRAEPALEIGSYRPLPATGDVVAYVREAAGRRFLIALNLGHSPARLTLPREMAGRVVLGTHDDREGAAIEGDIALRGDEAVVAQMIAPPES